MAEIQTPEVYELGDDRRLRRNEATREGWEWQRGLDDWEPCYSTLALAGAEIERLQAAGNHLLAVIMGSHSFIPTSCDGCRRALEALSDDRLAGQDPDAKVWEHPDV